VRRRARLSGLVGNPQVVWSRHHEISTGKSRSVDLFKLLDSVGGITVGSDNCSLSSLAISPVVGSYGSSDACDRFRLDDGVRGNNVGKTRLSEARLAVQNYGR
jgi:hypothetical protein